MADLGKSGICVLIPTYNERRNIARVISQIGGLGFFVLVVDDGSTDGTSELLGQLNVPCLLSEKNRGKGASIRRGIEWFLGDERFSVLVLMDGDGQHDPQELFLFLNALGNGHSDMVVGNRMARAKNMPLLRWWTNRLLSFLASRVAGQKIPDSQCGYRAMKRRVLETLTLFTDRFEIETEMLLQAARSGFKISWVPIRCVYNPDAESQIDPLKDTLRFLTFLCRYLLGCYNEPKRCPPNPSS